MRLIRSIVVGTDGSDTATEAVRHAAGLAKATGARVHVVSAYEPLPGVHVEAGGAVVPEKRDWAVSPSVNVEAVLERAAGLVRVAGAEAETHPREGDAADIIIDVAEQRDADLIVVGNKGMTGARRFLLGSVPDKISHHAPCSVLIVKTT